MLCLQMVSPFTYLSRSNLTHRAQPTSWLLSEAFTTASVDTVFYSLPSPSALNTVLCCHPAFNSLLFCVYFAFLSQCINPGPTKSHTQWSVAPHFWDTSDFTYETIWVRTSGRLSSMLDQGEYGHHPIPLLRHLPHEATESWVYDISINNSDYNTIILLLYQVQFVEHLLCLRHCDS